MSNPYPRQPGFSARVRYASVALRQYGADYDAAPYSRHFDNCFEMFDGKAVVSALMHGAIGGDMLLERGIRSMGAAVWPEWEAVYRGKVDSGPTLFNAAAPEAV